MGGISLSGYVVESVRIGSANGPYTTPQPDTTVDPVSFSLYFTDDEPVPTHEYAVFCREGGKLQEATFQWTKNDTIKRFGYSSSARTFKPLPGSAPVVLGDLSVDSNTERLIGGALISTDTVTYPIRISLSSGSVTIPSTVVLSFSTPPAPGTVNVRLSDGALDWAPDLISSYEGDSVSFQGQTFLEEPTATGNLGVISQNLYLNPIPSVGSFPILRIGFRFPLTALPVPDEASFPGSIPSGTVYYATDTGRLAFSATDLATYEGVSVYYDGTHVTGGFPVTLPAFGVGNVVGLFSSATLSPLPPEGGDILITLSSGGDTHTVPNTVRVTVHSGSVPANTVEIDPSGLLKFSSTDANNYSGWAITATVADLPLEHGVSVRFFRSLADPSQANPEIPDVTSVYTVENQKWAEPIQGVPFFFLPVIPLEDSSYPTVISILAGSGSYLTSDFPRLDRNPPPLTEGYGYILSEDDSRFYFGYRSVNRIFFPKSESTFALDPTVQKKGLLLEEETFPGSGMFAPLLEGVDFSLDPLSGTGTATSPVGPVAASGFSGSLDGLTGIFTDPSADFTGIPPGADLILHGNSAAAYRVDSVLNPNQILLSGIGPFFNSKGSYKIHTSPEILANRVWMPVDTADPNLSLTRERSLGSATNNPRMSVSSSEVSRFSVTLDEVPATSLSLVSSFTDPSSLPSGTVEVNGSSGLLNFSTGDLGKSVKAIITERPSLDFTVNPTLGFFEVNTRFFEGERATLSYRRADNLEPVTEAVRFLRRKVPVSHPVQTSTFEIPSGSQTFTNTPSPRIFRSGRPLTEGVDYTLNGKTVTLLPSNQVTKAFPSGPVAPEESVLVDFYVIDALGGEKTFSSVISPIYSPPVTLTAGSLTFKTLTDLTGILPPQTFLRFDRTEIAEVVSVSWDGSASTINVSSPIREDRTNPTIERIAPLTVSVDPYRPELVPVLVPASPSPVGSNTITFPGDVSSTFRTGCILRIGSFPYLVGGSSFNKDTLTTTVTLTTTLYGSVSQSTTMVVSSCPVVENGGGAFTVTLNKVPVSTVTVVREGQAGSTVTPTVEGQSTLTFSLLQEGETVFAIYTSARAFDPGIQLRFTGNSLVVPDTQTNGLLGQFLRASFSVYQPDSFYTRVVPIEKVFRGEVATELQPTNGGGGSGPTTENASGNPVLKDSGVPSLFWEERHWTNADLAAKSYLLYHHKLCDALDRILERTSGIVPGLTDGPFRYDGSISISSSVRAATNQIDDLITIAPGKTVPAYLAGATSRFFPAFRAKSRLSGSTTIDGEVILSTDETTIQAVSLFRARLSRALVVETAFVGDTVINLTSTSPPDSPPFQSGMAVVVQNPDGSFVVPPSSPLIILTVFPTFLSVTVPLLVEIPEGSTLYRSPLDTSGATPDLTAFQEGRDYDVDFEGGNILYKNPIPPYDGSDPAVPVSLLAKPIPSTTYLDFGVTVPYPFNAPDAIPALHGLPQTDDGEIETLPMVSPSFQCEWNSLSRGFLATEADLLSDLLTTTEDLHEYTVSVDGTGFVITNSGPWPAPAPVPGDLLQVLTGANTGDSFYPIISVGVSDLALGFALPVPGEIGISVAITVDAQTPSTGDILAGGTSLEDLTAPFVASDVGKPLIILSGPDAGQRRQIESVTATVASFNAPLTVTVGISYRIGQSIATFGSVSGGLFGDIADILLSSLQPLYTNIITDMEDFLDTLTVEQATGTTGSVAVPDTFSDLSADFSALSLPLFLEISSGPNEGLYPIDSFLSPTSLQIGNGGSSPTFSTLEGGVSYRVVQIPTSSASFAVSMTQKKQEIEDLIGQITSFFSLFSGVNVETLPLAYANRLRDAFVTARIAQNIARRSVSDAYASDFQPFLTSSPNAYGLRYAWISARIHRITGILSRVARAITNRKETVAQQIAGFLLAQQ